MSECQKTKSVSYQGPSKTHLSSLQQNLFPKIHSGPASCLPLLRKMGRCSGEDYWIYFYVAFDKFQDAAIKDLEHAIAFDGKPTFLEGRKGAGVHHPHGEEEEEISPPPDVKEEGGKEAEKVEEGHRCARCGKSFSRLSLLNR